MFNGDLSLFQFHKGTIKARKFLEPLNNDSVFQFHKGTIKALMLLLQI